MSVEEGPTRPITIRGAVPEDRGWITGLVDEHLGGRPVVSPSGEHDPGDLPGLIAVQGHERVGLLNYAVAGRDCEVVTLASLRSGIGIGTALIKVVRRIAVRRGCRRLWLVTTNDNLRALRFYQRRGFRIVAVHRNAMEHVRRRKPDVPGVGLHGIPLRDMIELDMRLEKSER